MPPKDADPDLIAEWDNLVKNLAKHENGHVLIIRGNILQPNLIQQLNDAYDARTNHGAAQEPTFGAYDPANTTFMKEFLPNMGPKNSNIYPLTPRKSATKRFAELNKTQKSAPSSPDRR